jgi:heat shock protein HslJ
MNSPTGLWLLDDVAGTEPIGMTPAFLSIAEDGSLHGSTGLNRFRGSWTVDEGRLFVEVTATTLMAGPPELMTQEQRVLELLATSQSAVVDGETLTFADGNGQPSLRYVVGVAELPGTAWQATGINNGAGAVASTADTHRAVLEFYDDGTVGGSTGVNQLTGNYELDAASLHLGPLATTRELGPPELVEQELQFLAALAAVDTWELDGTHLVLRDSGGATQATFQPVVS